jgi:hypothetical protein
MDQYRREVEAAESALERAQRKHRNDLIAAAERLKRKTGQEVLVVSTVIQRVPASASGPQQYAVPIPEARARQEDPQPLPIGWSREAALHRGEAQLVAWVDDGTLRSLAELAANWGVTPAALNQACNRAELFSLKVAGRRVVPNAFFELQRAAVTLVSRELQGLDASEQLIFWLRGHGGLAGRTIAKAIEDGELSRAVQVAAGWAEERGLRQGEAIA